MTTNGAHAFDFIYGRWQVHNRKLRDVTDPSCQEWVEFEATSEAFPVLHGTGHIDRIHVPNPADGEPFEGLTLRMFDPAADTWSIWWSSTRAPGHLDPPVVGHFNGTHGIFNCEDTIAGRTVMVRFEWHADPASPAWQQSFSHDAGKNWELNWVMNLQRL